MSKRPADEEADNEARRKRLRADVLASVSGLPASLRARIGANCDTLRAFLRFARGEGLAEGVTTTVLRVLVKRDILFPMMGPLHPAPPPPLRPTFARLWALKGMEPKLIRETDAAFRARVLEPTYRDAMQDVAAGMVAALRGLARRVDDTAYEVMHEATLWAGDSRVAWFAFDKTMDERYEDHFYLEDDALPVAAAFKAARWQASVRAMVDGDPALERALETMLVNLLLEVSPRLVLTVPVFELTAPDQVREGRVSVATWGQLLVAEAVDSSSSSSDEDYEEEEGEEEEEEKKRQTRLDEHFPRGKSPLENTFLGDFARTYSARQVSDVRSDAGPYNYLTCLLDGVRLEVRQTSPDDHVPSAGQEVVVVDLGAKTNKGLAADVVALRALGWGATEDIKDRLHMDKVRTLAKQKAMARFLHDTFARLGEILKRAADARAVVLLVCAVGLERSLVLFNLLAYGLAVADAAQSRPGATVAQLLRAVGSKTMRHARPDATGAEREIRNELMHMTIDSIPTLFGILLPLVY